MRCMEIRGGIQPIEELLSMPGLDGWLSSQPYQEASGGGDIHYVSLCAGGIVTRLILADVSGHGSEAATTASRLRELMKRNINRKSQTAMVRALNREFAALAESDRFATAVLATYLANKHRLTVCSAGHPRPLWFQVPSRTWTVLTPTAAIAANLPLGIDEDAPYEQFSIPLTTGDVLVFFTDGFIEASDPAGNLLSEAGLLELARGLPRTDDPREVGLALREAVAQHRGGSPAEDDLTIAVFRHNGQDHRWPGLGQTLHSIAKMCRIEHY